jgi:hypothetical protein
MSDNDPACRAALSPRPAAVAVLAEPTPWERERGHPSDSRHPIDPSRSTP